MQALLQNQCAMEVLAKGQMNTRMAKQQLSVLKSGVAATTRTAIKNNHVGSAGGAPGCSKGGRGESPALHALGRCAAWGAQALPGRQTQCSSALLHTTCTGARATHAAGCPRCKVGCTW